jgi:hypothetical protein
MPALVQRTEEKVDESGVALTAGSMCHSRSGANAPQGQNQATSRLLMRIVTTPLTAKAHNVRIVGRAGTGRSLQTAQAIATPKRATGMATKTTESTMRSVVTRPV